MIMQILSATSGVMAMAVKSWTGLWEHGVYGWENQLEMIDFQCHV